MDLLELAARCESASGADRELDAEIALACGWITFDLPGFGKRWQRGHGTVVRHHPDFSASLDAAMTLVPEGHDAQIFLYCGREGEGSAIVSATKAVNLPRVFAATPALALTAAALKALAQGATS
ncbi:MAG: hypothetical protein JWN66_4940 [Sphingomonas bacterium]|uniref:hypothetical protein n=1 Tax=Sphingomonas bacterium TaxID=1895847 RepID=UPI002605FAD6|nr:hypothetical protein [Sphingomonas bacterium]MDB5707824.1 hypothetical protein [Sphingomonas bacterium]